MNEQEKEKQFQKGFNHGYILTAHEPELARAIIDVAHKSKDFSEYSYGLSAGHDMYIVDNILPENVKLSSPAKELDKLNSPEKKFTKGFNVGYDLAKHEPELLSKIVKIPNENNDYFKGIQLGKKQFGIERMKEKAKGLEPKKKSPDKPKNIGKGK